MPCMEILITNNIWSWSKCSYSSQNLFQSKLWSGSCYSDKKWKSTMLVRYYFDQKLRIDELWTRDSYSKLMRKNEQYCKCVICIFHFSWPSFIAVINGLSWIGWEMNDAGSPCIWIFSLSTEPQRERNGSPRPIFLDQSTWKIMVEHWKLILLIIFTAHFKLFILLTSCLLLCSSDRIDLY